ncbi:MAG TPA: ABC transporter permease [Gaiellaceae bacterium]|jgi:peptide/nickel transport system permease protein|nr:ABC transporter permease [Gaiellaceae bacterium]
MSAVAAPTVVPHRSRMLRFRSTPLYRGVTQTTSGRIGFVICLLIVLIAFVGPYFSPYSPNAIVGLDYQPPSHSHWLGTDFLGRDGFSRFLWGGKAMIFVAVLSTLLAYLISIPLGLVAGFLRGKVDLATIALVDILLAFPPIVFILVLLSASGPRLSVVVIAIAVIQAPRIIRIVRTVAVELSTSDFVEAAIARGERLPSLMFKEILPNIWIPVLADVGLRLAHAVILFASLSFLGVALRPPASDWGLMVNENRVGLTENPWVTIGPVVMIALLTIGINCVADGAARTIGRSVSGADE